MSMKVEYEEQLVILKGVQAAAIEEGDYDAVEKITAQIIALIACIAACG